MFGTTKCVLFCEVSSFHGVLIRVVLRMYYKKEKGDIETSYHTVIEWGYFDVERTSLIKILLKLI